jgi:hypothetical protein
MLKPTFLNWAGITAGLLSLLPPTANAGQDSRKREEIINQHMKSVEVLLKKNPIGASPSQDRIDLIRKGCSTIVKEIFSDLKRNELMDEKMTSYQEYWKKLEDSPLLTRPESGKAFEAVLTSYSKNLALAAVGDRCTVSVSASKGNGAVVKYVKAVDAAAGTLSELGISTTQAEVEKAEYVFVTYRSGKETGRTSKKDCTGSKQIVEVSEN